MSWEQSLAGGLLIGLSVTWMLLSLGRVTGISGILNSVVVLKDRSTWKNFFLLGLVAGGIAFHFIDPEVFRNTSGRGLPAIVMSGLLVGFGTVLGSGCTSGHGICGLSRFSLRSLVATLTFMFFGALTVFLLSRWS